MDERILEILVRINVDFTLTDDEKDTLTDRINNCESEEDLLRVMEALEHYWESTSPIIEAALARKTDEELEVIDTLCTRLMTNTKNIIEEFDRDEEKENANALIY